MKCFILKTILDLHFMWSVYLGYKIFASYTLPANTPLLPQTPCGRKTEPNVMQYNLRYLPKLDKSESSPH